MKIIKPNYNECITNLSNSILKHFNCNTYHNTLPFIDEILDKEYKNVIVLLCDGMGSNLIDRILDKDSFLIKNRLKTITTVFPPTTTAATTSILSGLNPNEHGWLGWDLYFKNENKTVTMFLNTIKDTDIKATEYDIAKTTFPYKNIIKQIKDKGYEAYEIYSFKDPKYNEFSNLTNEVINLSQSDNKKFIYAYYDNPDSLFHEYGTDSTEGINKVKQINNEIENMCKKLKNSVVIVVADHGHINSKKVNLDNYLTLKNTLERTTSIEPRATSFKIKEGMEDIFINEFNKYLKDDFILYSHDEIIKSKIFGEGINNIHFNESIGDFICIAKSDKYIVYDNNSANFKSMHAGLTEDEMLIPLIVKTKR